MLKTLTDILSLFKYNTVTFIVTFLFYVNCGFFITFSSEGSALSAICPQYLFFYIALIYTLILIAKDNIIKTIYPVLLGLLTIFYVLITQFIMNDGRPIAILGSVVAILFYIIGTILLPKLSFKQVKFIADTTLIFSLIIFSIDTLYKLINCGFNVIYMFFHYRVKSSWLYPDTNTMGIQITFFIVLAYYLYKMERKFWYIPVICLYTFLAFCTFSRAAVIAILLVFGFDIVLSSVKIIFAKIKQEIAYYVVPIKKILSYIILSGAIFIGIFMTLYIMIYLLSDPSFGTKLDLFNDAFNFLRNANPKDLFFGIGFNNGRITEFSKIWYAHAYLTTYVCETGIIGYILFTTFLFSTFWYCKKTIYAFVPFLIIGFSYFGHTHLHVFYSVLLFITYFSKIPSEKNTELEDSIKKNNNV